MAKSKAGTPIGEWLSGKRSRIASRAGGATLQIKRIKSGALVACTKAKKGADKKCGIVPSSATIQEVRRAFRKAFR